jgi:hypothetical protein
MKLVTQYEPTMRLTLRVAGSRIEVVADAHGNYSDSENSRTLGFFESQRYDSEITFTPTDQKLKIDDQRAVPTTKD